MARSGRPLKVHSELEYFDHLIEDNNKKVLKKMIKKHGIDAYDGDRRTILINSAAKGNIEIAKFAIENGADVNFQDSSGYTSLHFCALYKYSDLTDLLLDKGADVNVCDEHGNPPIWTAIFNSKGDFEIVRKLYKAGGDIDTKNIHNKSPRELGETIYQDKFDELLIGKEARTANNIANWLASWHGRLERSPLFCIFPNET
jgi:ankyrin repeat protein